MDTLTINAKQRLRDVGFSTLFRDVEYIPLETSENFLVGKISKVLYFNDCFYLVDRMSKGVYIFDKDGKFVDKIGSVGRGPGEYMDLENIFIDEKKNELIVNAYTKYQVYDLRNHKLIRERKYVIGHGEKMYLGDECFASYLNNVIYGNIKRNVYIEKKGDVLDSYFHVKDYLKGFECQNAFVFSKDEKGSTYLIVPLNDTVYQISESGITPYLFIDFGDKKLPEDYMKSAPDGERLGHLLHSPYFKCAYNFVDNDHYLTFSVDGDDQGVYRYLFNKKTNERYLYRNIQMDENGVAPAIMDDIFFGEDYWISSFTIDRLNIYVDAVERCTSDPDIMKQLDSSIREKYKAIKNSAFYQKFKKMVDGLDEDANPVMVKLYLKLEE